MVHPNLWLSIKCNAQVATLVSQDRFLIKKASKRSYRILKHFLVNNAQNCILHKYIPGIAKNTVGKIDMYDHRHFFWDLFQEKVGLIKIFFHLGNLELSNNKSLHSSENGSVNFCASVRP